MIWEYVSSVKTIDITRRYFIIRNGPVFNDGLAVFDQPGFDNFFIYCTFSFSAVGQGYFSIPSVLGIGVENGAFTVTSLSIVYLSKLRLERGVEEVSDCYESRVAGMDEIRYYGLVSRVGGKWFVTHPSNERIVKECPVYVGA